MYIIFTIITFLCLCIYYRRKRCNNREIYPPGPMGLPFFGNLFQLGSAPHLTFKILSQTYGPIISFNFGTERAVIINDYRLIREAFSRDSFSGRAQAHLSAIGPGGILFSEGRTWKEQREFASKELKGVSRISMEKYAQTEIEDLLGKLEQTEGPVQANQLYLLSAINILWGVVGGLRFSEESHPEVIQLLREKQSAAPSRPSIGSSILFSLKWMRAILPKKLAKNVAKNQDLLHRMKEFANYTINFQHSPSTQMVKPSLLAAYNANIRKTKNPVCSFYKETGESNLVESLVDLLRTGTETTITTVAWTLLFLANDQEAQEEMRKEILGVIGPSRFPTLADIDRMPLTQATIKEVLRHSAMVPLGVQHRTLCDTWLGGYLIPKGTVTIGNLYAANKDEESWVEPHKFMPRRFLSSDGLKVLHNKAFMPFSYGKRICIGDWFSKNQFYLLFPAMFQRFRVLPYPTNQRISEEPDGTTILVPKPFELIFQKLNQD